MKLEEVRLYSRDLSAQRHFYCGVLGLPETGNAADTLMLALGSSRLVFKQAPAGWNGYYHFAFNIPNNQLAKAKTWVAARTTLLVDNIGADQFHSDNWDADQFYFLDPAGNILEFIARRSLANSTNAAAFSSGDILSVSEIGLAADDVPTTVRMLCAQLGVEVYANSFSDTFAAVGDAEGLLIIVKRERIWFPYTGLPAVLAPLELQVVVNDRRRQITGPPYLVSALAPA